MTDTLNAKDLIHTKQGQKWLAQFDPLDQEAAINLANALTLISHSEFKRKLNEKIIKTASDIDGVVAFFAVRELETIKPEPHWMPQPIPFYEQVTHSEDGKTVNAVGTSSDLGSEAIVAQIIRQICKANPKKYLNHPSLESLRGSKCDAIIFVDDFIGSGGRMSDFLDSFWLEPSVVSWLSSKHIKFNVLAYSGTESGIKRVERHKSKPKVHLHIDAPTFHGMFWSQAKKDKVNKLCGKYGRIANKNRKKMWWGFKQGMAAIVFEHGCPNNTPAILWEPDFKNSNWIGLFPNRTVDSSTASVFPPEIVRGDPILTLKHIGQKGLAKSGALSRTGEVGQTILIVLALIAKGQRKRSALCFAAGLSSENYERIIEKCIKWQFLTPQRRITPKGLAELKAARKSKIRYLFPPEKGSDYYYPRQLRGTAHD